MKLVYEATLTVTVTDETWANLDDAGLSKIVDDMEQIVDGPLGEALVEAIIAALGDPDKFDVTLA